MPRPYYRRFAAYVADYPAGARFQRWLAPDPPCLRPGRPSAILSPAPVYLLSSPVDSGRLPGGYVRATIALRAGVPFVVGDNDDLAVAKPCATRVAALRELEELTQLAPFTLGELQEFGYAWD